MLENYIGIVAMFLMALGISIVFVLATQALGPNKPNPTKAMPFEAGKPPFEKPSGRHSVRFYLVGMLFVIFDIELIFLFPWAVVFKDVGLIAFWAMFLFLIIFELGFVYAWRKGALQWK